VNSIVISFHCAKDVILAPRTVSGDEAHQVPGLTKASENIPDVQPHTPWFNVVEAQRTLISINDSVAKINHRLRTEHDPMYKRAQRMLESACDRVMQVGLVLRYVEGRYAHRMKTDTSLWDGTRLLSKKARRKFQKFCANFNDCEEEDVAQGGVCSSKCMVPPLQHLRLH
jgi:hypothetical protein